MYLYVEEEWVGRRMCEACRQAYGDFYFCHFQTFDITYLTRFFIPFLPIIQFYIIHILIHIHISNTQGEKQDELYLNLVLEYVPETVYSISRQHQKSKMALPLLYVKLYLYQLSRALSHIHSLGICHRDIKPQNLLVNPVNQQLKLCDFGSAKALVKGEPNVSYICSRYYRAPELIFGSTDYSTAIDIWSQGRYMCVYMCEER